MPSTTTYEFGAVVLVPFPFTDQSDTKQRPAVVVSSAAYEQERRDVIIMAITSRFAPTPRLGEVIISEWKEAGLAKPSAIKPAVLTIEKSLVRKRLGTLGTRDVTALRRTLRDIIEIEPPR